MATDYGKGFLLVFLASYGIGQKGYCGRKTLSTVSTFTELAAVVSTSYILVSLVLAADNMYVYEGKDYSKSSDPDKEMFEPVYIPKYKVQLRLRLDEIRHAYFLLFVGQTSLLTT